STAWSSRGSRTRSPARSSPCSATRPVLAAWASPAVSGCRSGGPGTSSPSGPNARTKRRASRPLADSVQDPPCRGGKIRCKAIERPDAALCHVHEPGLAKLGHVMRNGRLRDVEGRREVADADRLLGIAEAQRNLEPRWVREGLQNLGRLFDLFWARLQRRRATHAPLALGEHHELFHGIDSRRPIDERQWIS